MDPDEVEYKGFFYDSVSSDIVAKVILNIFLLLLIILIMSLFVSRRCKRLILQSEDEVGISKYLDLFSSSAISKLSKRQGHDKRQFALKFDSHNLLLIEKWFSIDKAQKNFHLKTLFSKFPNDFKNNWRGLMFSDQFSAWIIGLDCLFQCSLQNFSLSEHIEGAHFGLQSFFDCKLKDNLSNLDATDFRLLSLHILFVTVLIHPLKTDLMKDDSSITHSVVLKLDALLQALVKLHSSGKIPSELETSEYCSIEELLKYSAEFLRPFILFEVSKHTNPHINYAVVETANHDLKSTLLSRILFTKFALEEEGEDLSFLTTTHLSHTLIEVFLIGQFALSRCLHTIFTVLARRTDWQEQLINETVAHGKDCTNHMDCFTTESTCLRWSKALCLETIRYTVAGWPFGCLREAFREGNLGLLIYNSRDLILLNEPAVFHDPDLWFSSDDRPFAHLCNSANTQRMPFNPFNFDNLEDETTDCLVFALLLNSNACFLPRHFLYHSLLTTLLEFVQCGWTSEIDNTDSSLLDASLSSEFSPHILPLGPVLPPISFSQFDKTVCNNKNTC